MSRFQTLTEAREEGWAIVLRNFVRIHTSKPDCLFCFFEGEDVKYYSFRIKENLPNVKWEGINCKGKTTVLTVYQKLKEHENQSYQQARKTFFVDRDFDEPLPDDVRQEVYETPCHSIENFYTSVDCFKGILKYEFKINEFGEEDEKSLFQQCLGFFEETQRMFHQAITEFNAWIIVALKNKVGLNLRDYQKDHEFDELVRIEINKVEKLYTGDILFECASVDESKKEELAKKVSEVSFSNPRCEFRGKQELQFFIKFLTKLKDDLSTKKRKISFPIPTNPLSALTQYADTPQCLRDYFSLRR